jgi:Chalcone isomerase-like
MGGAMCCDNRLNIRICFVILLMSGFLTLLMAKSVNQDTLHIDDITLILNGSGLRTAIGMRIYKGGLYLEQKSNKAQEIIDTNAPMAVLMEIKSSLITGERLEKSTRDGFQNATGGNALHIKNEIEAFIALIKANLCVGDQYLFVYIPQKGTRIIKNGQIIGVINGFQFKKALFGIWLCSKPPQQELKKGMLGL